MSLLQWIFVSFYSNSTQTPRVDFTPVLSKLSSSFEQTKNLPGLQIILSRWDLTFFIWLKTLYLSLEAKLQITSGTKIPILSRIFPLYACLNPISCPISMPLLFQKSFSLDELYNQSTDFFPYSAIIPKSPNDHCSPAYSRKRFGVIIESYLFSWMLYVVRLSCQNRHFHILRSLLNMIFALLLFSAGHVDGAGKNKIKIKLNCIFKWIPTYGTEDFNRSW